MVFSRKYRYPEHYFSVWSLGNSPKLLTRNQFLASTIFFTIMNISFFSLHFDLFSIIAKEINQIRNNIVCSVARVVFLCTHYPPLQCFSTYFRKCFHIFGVLRPIFPDYVISCDYVLTVFKISYFQEPLNLKESRTSQKLKRANGSFSI